MLFTCIVLCGCLCVLYTLGCVPGVVAGGLLVHPKLGLGCWGWRAPLVLYASNGRLQTPTQISAPRNRNTVLLIFRWGLRILSMLGGVLSFRAARYTVR